MTELNLSLPAHFYVQVRAQYLHNLEVGHGEFEEAAVFGARSVPNRALGFHVHLKSGGVFWNLPVSALCHTPHAEHLRLSSLEAWDAFAYRGTVTSFDYLRERECRAYLVEQGVLVEHEGLYAGVTVDWMENGYSDEPTQQKCLHLVRLECGCYALLPNNRLLWLDQSFVVPPAAGERPTYRANSHVFWSEE